MATPAQVIVEAGYAKSSNSDPGKMAGDGELLNRLDRVFQTIYAMAAIGQRRDEFTSACTLTFLAGPPIAAALSAATPAQVDVIDIIAASGVSGTVAAGAKIHVINAFEKIKTTQIPPSIYRRGLSILTRGQAGDPTTGDVIQLELIDSPARLTTLATNIDARFAVRWHELLVNTVAMYLMAKDGGDPNRFQQIQADQSALSGVFAKFFEIDVTALEATFRYREPRQAQQ